MQENKGQRSGGSTAEMESNGRTERRIRPNLQPLWPWSPTRSHGLLPGLGTGEWPNMQIKAMWAGLMIAVNQPELAEANYYVPTGWPRVGAGDRQRRMATAHAPSHVTGN